MRFENKEETLRYYGYFWNRVWNDPDFLRAAADAAAMIQEQLELDLASLGGYFSRLEIPTTRRRQWVLLQLDESDRRDDVVRYGFGGNYGDDWFYGDSSSPRGHVFPLTGDTRSPFLLNSPAKASLILTRGVDYFYRDSEIVFRRNPFTQDFKLRLSQDDDPGRSLLMWEHRSEEDLEALRDFYGACVGMSTKSTEFFKRLVNAVWDLRVEGVTTRTMTEFLGAVTDTGVPVSGGVVLDSWSEGGRNHVLLNEGVLSADSAHAATVVVGDELEPGESPFGVFEVARGGETVAAADFPACHAHRGLLGGEYESGVLVENVDVPVTFELWSGDPNAGILLDSSGNPLENGEASDPELFADSSGAIQAGAAVIPIFRMGGSAADVKRFRHAMARSAWLNDRDLKTEIIGEQKGPIYYVNPFQFIRTEALSTNCLFIKLKASALRADLSAQKAFTFLRDAVPAGSCFLLYFEHECTVDVITSSEMSESLEGVVLADELSDVVDSSEITDHVEGGVSLG